MGISWNLEDGEARLCERVVRVCYAARGFHNARRRSLAGGRVQFETIIIVIGPGASR